MEGEILVKFPGRDEVMTRGSRKPSRSGLICRWEAGKWRPLPVAVRTQHARVFTDSSQYRVRRGWAERFSAAHAFAERLELATCEHRRQRTTASGASGRIRWLGLLASHVAGRRWARFVPFLLLRVDIRPVGF